MDPIPLAAGAVGSAVGAGLAVVSTTTLLVDLARSPAGTTADVAGPFYLLLAGTLAGLVLAGLVAWRLLRVLGSAYRRGGLAMVSAFATVLAMLVCIPVNQLLGHAGLIGLVILSVIVSWLLARLARAAAATP